MEMSSTFILSLVSAILLTSPTAYADPVPQTLEASALLSEIDTSSPKAVFARLWANQRDFDEVCGRIATGDAQWLEVARRLRSVSDAAASLSLNFSVARALPAAPVRVLRLVGRPFLIDDICTSPFIEPEAGVAERYEARALQALAALRDTQLKSLAEQCADGVRLPSP
jgi:hypothetical protein